MNAQQVLDQLEATLEAANGRLFAVLDGARNDDLYPALRKSQRKYTCLFDGDLAPGLRAAAPTLVDLGDGNNAFTEWLAQEGWGDAWGIFLVSDVDLYVLRRHLRTFLMVRRGDKSVYFRYYDPRVLRVYLPTCEDDELEFIFGPVAAFCLEDKDPEHFLCFSFDETSRALQTRDLSTVNVS